MVRTLPPQIDHVLVDEQQLAAAVTRLASEVNRDYAGRELVVVGALTGAVVVVADLVRRLEPPVRVDFVAVSSYGDDTVSSGTLRWRKPLDVDLAGRDVLLVEDIVDSGVTLSQLQAALLAAQPASLATLVLLDKPARREVVVPLDYVGLEIPDEFVVGYGLDYAQQFRQLPYVGVLKRAVYS